MSWLRRSAPLTGRAWVLPGLAIAVLGLAWGQPLRAVPDPRVLQTAIREPAIVRIEAGWFEMGTRDPDVEYAVALCSGGLPEQRCQPSQFRAELPARRVFVGAFGIDRYEVSNADYRRCQLSLACVPARVSAVDPRVGSDLQPAVSVTAGEAERYCRWAGGRLPTEAEWERAARGGGTRRFPWGDQYNSRIANHGTANGQPDPVDGYSFAAPVTAFPDGRSAHGLLNMAGNVWEWTADGFRDDYYGQATAVDPLAPDDLGLRSIRGGSWQTPAHFLRATARAGVPASEHRPDLGFRCAY